MQAGPRSRTPACIELSSTAAILDHDQKTRASLGPFVKGLSKGRAEMKKCIPIRQ